MCVFGDFVLLQQATEGDHAHCTSKIDSAFFVGKKVKDNS